MDLEAEERLALRRKAFRVGLLFFGALGLSLFFAYLMGAVGVGSRKHLYVDFNFAGGIDKGSTVRMAGIKVGRVSEIRFLKHDTENQKNIRIELSINSDAFAQITQDSEFHINLAGLIGERYIEIVPGRSDHVASQVNFLGEDPPRIDQLLSQGYGAFADLRDFFQNNKSDIKEILASLNSLSNSLNSLVGNQGPASQTPFSKDLRSTISSLKDVAGRLDTATRYAEVNGAREAWQSFQSVLQKANDFNKVDFQRLLLEDGVRVRFTSKEVPAPASTQIPSSSPSLGAEATKAR